MDRTRAWTTAWNSGLNAWQLSGSVVHTKHHYGADDRLRLVKRLPVGSVSIFEEYRYDALGRRVLTRLRRGGTSAACGASQTAACIEPITRFVWDGDQLLYELRADGSPAVTGTSLETESGSGNFLGQVDYLHAGGIDQPLVVFKPNLGQGAGVVPHASWRGTYESGTYLNGASADGQTWPAKYQDAYYAPDARFSPPAPTIWLGGLLDGKADGSGLIYQRNRYYDPKSSRLTQLDPIGIAGRMNTSVAGQKLSRTHGMP